MEFVSGTKCELFQIQVRNRKFLERQKLSLCVETNEKKGRKGRIFRLFVEKRSSPLKIVISRLFDGIGKDRKIVQIFKN